MANLQTEIWVKDIQEAINEDNSFLSHSVNHSEFVERNIVNLPQSGLGAGVVMDRNSFPATVEQRTDSNLTYQLNQFTTNPVLITDLESYQISYNKRQSVLGQQYSTLSEKIAQNTLSKWSPSGAAVISASGGVSGTTTSAMAPSATGLRKVLVKEDILKAKRKLDLDNVPQSGRVLMISADQLYDLLQDAELRNQAGTGFGNSVMADGSIGKLFGFTVFMKNTLPVYTGGGAPKTGAAAASDNVAALAWHKDFVCNAMGDIKIFMEENSPVFFGDVLSSLTWHGASKLRTDGKGVVAIMQGA